MNYLVLLLTLFTLISCGDSKSSLKDTSLNTPQLETLITDEEESIEGQYLAKMIPLNPHISAALDSAVTLSLEGDEFIGDVRFFGNLKTASTSFMQTIHMGDRCPTLSDDINGDGIIDEVETLKVVKEIIIPLDSDLNSQWIGLGTNPKSDEFGSYYYSSIASWTKFLDDLWEEDINHTDNIIKISSNTLPLFEGRVALIRGISSQVFIPSTVSSQGRSTIHSGLPVSCGVLSKVRSLPGRRNIDRYPYPITIGEQPTDNPPIGELRDDLTPDYDIEPTGPIINYGDE